MLCMTAEFANQSLKLVLPYLNMRQRLLLGKRALTGLKVRQHGIIRAAWA